jgi:murein L,D-transpeptidase YafK
MTKYKRKPLPDLIEPKIIVKKSQRILELYSNDRLVRTYKIALGSNPNEDKQIEGDGSTPLGEFYVYTKNDKSKFYLSLGLSYPNIEDAKRGLRDGLITQEEHDAIINAIVEKKMPPQNTKLGGEIYIHGGTVGKQTDWTQGCVALYNNDIKELYDAVPVQTPVVIMP